jgi:hypothetical protein
MCVELFVIEMHISIMLDIRMYRNRLITGDFSLFSCENEMKSSELTVVSQSTTVGSESGIAAVLTL